MLPAKQWTWSDGMYRLHGAERTVEPLAPGSQAIVERVAPEERARVGRILSVLDDAGARHEEVLLEYWVLTDGPAPRRVRLTGQLEPVPGSGRISWVGSGEDVSDAFLSARALSVLDAAEEAFSRWRSFAPSLEGLLRALAARLDSPQAMAWTRGVNGRLGPRLQWGARGSGPAALASRAGDTAVGAHHRSLARTVWATREPVARSGGFGVPATWHGETVAALTFDTAGAPYLDDRLARSLRWVGSALGRRLTGDRPEMGQTKLSEREREVLQLAADGYDGPAIAQHLFVSPATVKTHFLHVYEKLGVNDRAAAVARALRQGLIS